MRKNRLAKFKRLEEPYQPLRSFEWIKDELYHGNFTPRYLHTLNDAAYYLLITTRMASSLSLALCMKCWLSLI